MQQLDMNTPAVKAAIEAGLDLQRIPAHIAIIMDGNGRWAAGRGLPRLIGHRQGYKTVRNIVREASDLGVKALTLYTFSTENWRRPEEETTGLMKLIGEAARQELRSMYQNGVKVQVSGRINGLPTEVREELQRGMETTKDNDRIVLNLAINYGGRAEIVDAMRMIAVKVAAGELSPEQIDEQTVEAQLYTAGLPDPDLLIRTAGEKRLSNFLIWQTAYSELHITPTLWPDFTLAHLVAAIDDYQKRVRKFGGVVNS
ncbi:MAG: isoprenyl transferase [Armatimonadota bacterium]